MSLSKKNLSKLNNFIKENNLSGNDSFSKENTKSEDTKKINDPDKIFYSIIDNSNNLSETSESNQLLKNCEYNIHKKRLKDPNYSNHLSIEDQLYDEFKYLLDE